MNIISKILSFQTKIKNTYVRACVTECVVGLFEFSVRFLPQNVYGTVLEPG